MTTIAEVEKLAFDLPEDQRAILAEHLLASLAPVLHDEDEGEAEAAHRDAEMDANSSLGTPMVFEPHLVTPPMPSDARQRVLAVLAQRFDSGDTDAAARHNEHQP